MKKTYYILFILIASMCISACSKQTSAPLETYSADKEMKITLTASRTNSLDPWMVDVELQHAGKTTNVSHEFYADEVSDKNVSFDWQSERDCMIHLTQRDGEVITIPILVNE